ncbi:MAG: ribonuclease Z [Hyphomicrobiaceae bacterium]|jgi:ribonuclease Z
MLFCAVRVRRCRIDAILLTHFHSDHIDGLGELLMQRWANSGSTTPTPVIGPEGVDEVVAGFNAAYRLDKGYRVAHHGAETIPPSGHGGKAQAFVAPADGEGPVVFDEDGVRITAFRVDHEPIDPSVGYRFDYAGRSVVISGDTVKFANLQHFAKGVDLLVHEGLAAHLVAVITDATVKAGRSNLAKITNDIRDYHTTPVQAAEIARDADVGYLLYNHIVPPLLIAPMEELFLEGVADVYSGRHGIGRDGTLVSLPAGSTAIEVEELL